MTPNEKRARTRVNGPGAWTQEALAPMSRKDYVAIAEILRETPMTSETRAALVARFVTTLADDNPSFSPSRFREACETVDARDALDRARAVWARTEDQLELAQP